MSSQISTLWKKASKFKLIEYYTKTPIITRTIFSLSILLSLATHLKAIPYEWFMYSWENVVTNYRVWTPITTFMVQPIEFRFFFYMYFLSEFSSSLESVAFLGDEVDYFYFLFLTMLSCLLSISYLGTPFLYRPFLLAIFTLWANDNPEKIITFFSGAGFRATNLPFVLTGIEFLLTKKMPIHFLFGIAFAYLYDYLTGTFVQSSKYNVFGTPKFIERVFPRRVVQRPRRYNPAPRRQISTGSNAIGSFNSYNPDGSRKLFFSCCG